MAFPTYIGKATTVDGTTGASPDFTSSGRAAGDFLLIPAATSNEAVSPPGDWTAFSVSPQGQGTAGASSATRISGWYKTSDGTETTIALTGPSNHIIATGIVYRPASGCTIAINGAAGKSAAATTSQSGNALTTTVADAAIIEMWACARDNTTPGWSSLSNADLTNLTERQDSGTSLGSGSYLGVFTGERATPGSIAATTATFVGSFDYSAITLALVNVAAGTPIGLASETDTALALGAVQSRAAGLAISTDTALALVAVQYRAFGVASTTGTAHALGMAVTIGRASETDAASAIGTVQIVPIGRADEADAALALVAVHRQIVGRADEADAALALSLYAGLSVGLAVETDTALALSGLQRRAIGSATAIETAFALPAVQSRSIGFAGEQDSALALVRNFAFAIGRADEFDVALALAGQQRRAIGLTAETDAAIALALASGTTLMVPGIAIDIAIPVHRIDIRIETWPLDIHLSGAGATRLAA